MAYTELTMVAGGNIAPFRFVRVDTTANRENACVQATDNGDIIGVAQPGTNLPEVTGMITPTWAATDRQQVQVAGVGSICLLEIGASVTNGQYLRSDANGRGVPVETSGTTLRRYGAIALQAGSSGDRIRVQVLIGMIRPAIT